MVSSNQLTSLEGLDVRKLRDWKTRPQPFRHWGWGERKNVETSVHRNQGSHLEDVRSITTGDLVNPIIRLLEVQVGAAHCRTPITLGGQQEKTKETPGEPNKSSSTTGRGGGAKGTQDASQSESQSRPLEAPRSPFEAEKTPCGKRG